MMTILLNEFSIYFHKHLFLYLNIIDWLLWWPTNYYRLSTVSIHVRCDVFFSRFRTNSIFILIHSKSFFIRCFFVYPLCEMAGTLRRVHPRETYILCQTLRCACDHYPIVRTVDK